MLRIVENGLWAEVDSSEEAYDELPTGTRFWHDEFGQCISLDLEEHRTGVRRFWYFARSSRMPKVYQGTEHSFKFKIAAKFANSTWPDPQSVDWRGNPL